jgi:hypothetical protein
MSMENSSPLKPRGPSAVRNSVEQVRKRSSRQVEGPRSPAAARPTAATRGNATADYGPRNDHLASHFPHTLEPAA